VNGALRFGCFCEKALDAVANSYEYEVQGSPNLGQLASQVACTGTCCQSEVASAFVKRLHLEISLESSGKWLVTIRSGVVSDLGMEPACRTRSFKLTPRSSRTCFELES
jgi:hypothetical protein